MAPFALRMIAAAWIATLLISGRGIYGQSAWYEGFESPEPTWRDAGGNARYRIQRHQRIQGEAHVGDGCEKVTILGNNGTYVHLSHDVGHPRVIEELLPTVWVKSDRPGLQFLAQVVLPRTEDPRTGQPMSTLLRGSSYTNVGRWQQLRIDDMPQLLARQVRILRSQSGPNVDALEAYLDRVVLNVYGGPGTTNVWIDDLDIAGYVDSPPPSLPSSQRKAVIGESGGNAVVDVRQRRRVELAGSVLMVEGRPMFPRIIHYQGESLAFLQRLGFNAVWLDRPVSPELLHEADRLGLWLICPPPRPNSPYVPDERVATPSPIGPHRQVLAWDLGWGLSEDQLETTRDWAKRIRLSDRDQNRPLICRPESNLREYSRYVDLLLIDRQPLGTSLELAEWSDWLQRRPLLARPGTTIWATVQTQPAAGLRRQLVAMQPGRRVPPSVSNEQIRLLVYASVASGVRGLLFQSDSPLNADDLETRQRAMALELLNLELQLIEPWTAAGSLVGNARASRPEVIGSVLRTDRSRLLLPIWSAPAAQFVPGPSAVDTLSMVVPGVPESSRAYELAPGGLQPLRHKRVTLGTRVTLQNFGLTGLVIFAQDPLVVNSLGRRAAEIAERAAQLQRELAAGKLQLVTQVVSSGNTRTPGRPREVATWMDSARQNLQACDGYLRTADYHAACRYARKAMQLLRLVERTYWGAVVEGLTSPLSSPATVSFATLPWHHGLTERLACSRPGPSLLPGGDFEDLNTVLRAGWRHYQHSSPGLVTGADLLPEGAYSGVGCLRLTAAATDPENPPTTIETPPVWITTPPVPVEAGQLVCIQGRIDVPAAITGSVDGLLIVDSLSGDALAQRIGRTSQWQQFAVYRVAPQSGQMTVTFALSGLGEARLDDVTIQVLHPSGIGGITRRRQTLPRQQ